MQTLLLRIVRTKPPQRTLPNTITYNKLALVVVEATMSGNTSGGSQIKGGGQAVMSDASQQAIISLLMRLRGTPDVVDDDSKDERSRKREERRFVKKLVDDFERDRLARRYNLATLDSAESKTGGIGTATTTGEISIAGRASAAAEGKVRVELVEAIEKKGSTSKNDSKGKKKKDPSDASQSSNFKEGTRRVVVFKRSTSVLDLCKQGQSKLRMKKKPARAFLIVKETVKTTIVDLETDLSGVEDGTLIYLTSTPKTTLQPEENQVNDEETTRDNEPKADPLEQVKEAYIQYDRQRRREWQSNSRLSKADVAKTVGISPSKAIVEARAKLPAASYRTKVLDSIRSCPVTVVFGSTGCGKSTQIPQYILEDQLRVEQEDKTAVPSRPYTVVTQPRRVAAVSLAQRVSEEVGGPLPGLPGSQVGYIVRLDRRVAEGTCRIVYCTVGVLLRMLVCPQDDETAADDVDMSNGLPPLSLETISHLVLDEVHERDVQTDFCLTLLKGLLPSLPHMRLVLMSATASADTFVNYFAPVTSKMASLENAEAVSGAARQSRPTVLEIPGRTFPVDIQWLPDCERYASVRLSQPPMQQHHLPKTNVGGTDDPVLSPRATERIDNRFIRSLIGKIVEQQRSEGQLNVSKADQDGVRDTGAILVFLPGRAEIDALARCLKEDEAPGILLDRNVCMILKLHSSIPRSEQRTVFQRVRHGTVKIVLATNLAETSITIPDISHVIDTGRVKESRFNASTRIKELVTVWTSQASLKQRAGRSGRTSSGICWRLFTEDFYKQVLIPRTAPEMVRTPLDELILQICLLYEHRRDKKHSKTENDQNGGRANDAKNFPHGVCPVRFLSKTPSPPPLTSLVEACRHLLEVDALRVLDDEENGRNSMDGSSSLYRLTPLGYHLSRLPVDSKVGKILIVGCILGCLDGALTLAAALTCTKSCFISNLRKNDPSMETSFKAREALVENGFGGQEWPGGTVKSDLIAVIATYRAWKQQNGEKKKWAFCKSHALDNFALFELDQLRHQLLECLRFAGFLTIQNQNEAAFDQCNMASEDALLTSCCLVGGLYPNICTLIRPQKGRKGGRLLTKDGDICRPSSSSFQHRRIQKTSSTGKDAYAVYHAKQKSIGTTASITTGAPQRPPEVFLQEVNFISRFSLLLFGGEVEIVNNAIILDGWLKFKVSQESSSPKSTAAVDNAILIQALRKELDDVMTKHILENCTEGKARKEMPEHHKAVIQVVRQLLAEEG